MKVDDAQRKFTMSDYGTMDLAKTAALIFHEKVNHAIVQFEARKGQARAHQG